MFLIVILFFNFQKLQNRERRGEQEHKAIEFCRINVDAKAFARCKIDDFVGIAVWNDFLGHKVFSVTSAMSQLGF